jgi:putative SOS response-associated peptidase YedK
MTDNGPMIMAGLWATWKDPKSGNEIPSCTILTTDANGVMSDLHNRMPVILAEKDWAKWLGEEPATNDELLVMLKPCNDSDLKIWPVDKRVGNVRNKGPELALAV